MLYPLSYGVLAAIIAIRASYPITNGARPRDASKERCGTHV
jgi:hypothetical protein